MIDRRPPATILFIAANPSTMVSVAVSKELKAVREEMREARFRDCFELRNEFEVQAESLPGLLLHHRPTVVHFSGHGMISGEISFQTTSGAAQFVSPETISEVFRVHGGCIRCVVLNACYTETQGREIVRHIETVVGMRAGISDADAISFSAGFYEALAYGCSVGRAFESARVRLALEDASNPEIAVLLSRPGHNASGVYLHPDAIEALEYAQPESRRGKSLRLEFSESFDDFDVQDRRKLQEILRLVTGDPSLRIIDVTPGSIVVTIDVSERGARHLRELFDQGLLSAKLRMSIRELAEVFASNSVESTIIRAKSSRGRGQVDIEPDYVGPARRPPTRPTPVVPRRRYGNFIVGGLVGAGVAALVLSGAAQRGLEWLREQLDRIDLPDPPNKP